MYNIKNSQYITLKTSISETVKFYQPAINDFASGQFLVSPVGG